MSIRVSLWMKWCVKLGSQLLSLILKSLVMIRTLMLTSVSLRYFKAACDESEYILIQNQTTIEKKNTRNVSMIKNIFLQ